MSAFSVSRAELEAHAGQVQGVAADVALCRAAGTEVGFGGTEAYGLFLQFVLPPVLEMALGDTCDLLDQADLLGQAMSTGVQANNAQYFGNDDAIADLLRAIGDAGW
ncbi:hypothetical protein J2S43_000143 [Catenuloplanes nepalensis]|uniref:Excreted virulence factor EspC (Type VII ESX diderm) n=1 Tax=Catenuloplanes nepalensis TaxID=587533 RepID=A0ABT9MKP0_9ACTN|nr:hypothetical protein [Catenuloplanes nepalensis]MDP9791631.1 hypothetical protein [Catenuloplanes nepalensis]